MEAQKQYNKIKKANSEQLFIKRGEKLEPVNILDLKIDEKTVYELKSEYDKMQKMFNLLNEKLKNAGYEHNLQSLNSAELVSRKKTAQKKLVQKLISKGVL